MNQVSVDQIPNDFVPGKGRLDMHTGLWDCIDAIARKHPDKLAIDDGNIQLSYSECMKIICRWSCLLQSLHINRNQISIILLDTGINSTLATLAHIAAGVVFVPVDVAISTERIANLIVACHPAVIVTESKYAGLVEQCAESIHVILVDQIAGTRNANSPAPLQQEVVCRVLTSGSTGTPKQIIYTQKMILHDVCIRTDSLKFSPSDRFCQWIGGTSLPLMTLFLSVLNGASLHIHDIHSKGLESLPKWIRDNQITVLRLTPTLLRLFLKQNPRTQDLSSVRLVSTGGEAIAVSDIETFRKIFPPHTVLLNHLSATEYRVACQYFMDRAAEIYGTQVPVGYPVEDFEIAIMDDRGDPLPDGEIGEIAIRSEYISPGYVDPDSGEMRQFPKTPDGFYLSGDLGSRRADQCIEHHGRKDHMAKVRGIRLQLDEVESVLTSLDGIDEAVALVVTTPNNETILVACITEQAGSSVSLNQLRQALHSRIGLFGMPHYLDKRDSLPLTPNGKIDRVKLKYEVRLQLQKQKGAKRMDDH